MTEPCFEGIRTLNFEELMKAFGKYNTMTKGDYRMTALLEKVLTQASQLPDVDQDAVAERLMQTLTQFEQEKQGNAKRSPKFGSAKGLGYMTPDFEEPLAEFKA